MNVWIAALLALIFGSAAIAGLSAAPWVPTKPAQRRRLIASLSIQGDATCYDLGCGDGTILFELIRKYPNANAIGYDISLLPLVIGLSRKYSRPNRHRRVSLLFGNLFKKSIADADVVFVFLLAKSYDRLKSKFSAELKPDALIVVEAWPFPGIQPEKTLKEEGLLPVYFYRGSQFRG